MIPPRGRCLAALCLALAVTSLARGGPPAEKRADRYGDPLPDGALLRLGTVRLRHESPVLALAFAPDGKSLFSGGYKGTVRQWGPVTGKELRRLSWENGCVMALGVSPSAKDRVLVAGSYQSTIRVWDWATGKLLHQLDGNQGSIYFLTFTPDGKALASGGADNKLHLWDLTTGKELAPVQHPSSVAALAFAPDGKLGASADYDRNVRLWEVGTGKELHRMRGHQGRSFSLAFSPDGKTLISATEDNTVRWWDVATGKEVRQLQLDQPRAAYLALSPDGKLLASAGTHRSLRLWDLAAGKELHRLEVNPFGAGRLIFSPDGKTLVSAVGPRIRCWDVATGKELCSSPEHDNAVRALTVSADGKYLASASNDQTVRLWDLAAGKELRQFRAGQSPITLLGFSGDGKALVAAEENGTLRAWQVSTGKEYNPLGAQPPELASRLPPALAGNTLALVDRDRRVVLWDLASGKERARLAEQREEVLALALSPDARTLAVLGPRTVNLHDVAADRQLRQFDWPGLRDDHRVWRRSFPSLVFAPDGRALACGYEDQDSIYLWEVATGQEVGRLKGHGGGTTRVAFSPDGRSLASAGRFDQTVRLWELATGKEYFQGAGNWDGMTPLAFTSDGNALAVGRADTTVLLWDLAGRRPSAGQPAAADLPRLWADLAGDAVKARQAMGKLIGDPGQAVPFLKKQLQPAPPVPPQIKQLIANLDGERFEVREKAAKDLEELGDSAGPALREVLESKPSLEVRRRVERLLARLDERELSAERLQALRAVEVLERAGTAEARQVLAALAAGAPGAWLTRQAKASLMRLGK